MRFVVLERFLCYFLYFSITIILKFTNNCIHGLKNDLTFNLFNTNIKV